MGEEEVERLCEKSEMIRKSAVKVSPRNCCVWNNGNSDRRADAEGGDFLLVPTLDKEPQATNDCWDRYSAFLWDEPRYWLSNAEQSARKPYTNPRQTENDQCSGESAHLPYFSSRFCFGSHVSFSLWTWHRTIAQKSRKRKCVPCFSLDASGLTLVHSFIASVNPPFHCSLSRSLGEDIPSPSSKES